MTSHISLGVLQAGGVKIDIGCHKGVTGGVKSDNGECCQVAHTNLPLLRTDSFVPSGLQPKFSKSTDKNSYILTMLEELVLI